MAKNVDVIRQISGQLGLDYIATRNMGIGKYHDFTVFVYTISVGYSSASYYGATIFASKDDKPIDASELTFGSMPKTAHPSVQGYSVKLTIGALGKTEDITARIFTALASTISALKAAGYVAETPDNVINPNDSTISTPPNPIDSSFEGLIKDENAKENVVAGLIGALLGALGGFFLMVILGGFGYVSTLAGVFLGILTVIGYVKSAKNYSMIGLLITSTIVVITTYIAFKTGASLRAYKELSGYDVSFMEVYKGIKDIYKAADAQTTYYFNLVMSMIAGLGGGLVTTYASTDLIKKK